MRNEQERLGKLLNDLLCRRCTHCKKFLKNSRGVRMHWRSCSRYEESKIKWQVAYRSYAEVLKSLTLPPRIPEGVGSSHGVMENVANRTLPVCRALHAKRLELDRTLE